MSTSLRPLLSSPYIPFGTQYYRAPSPPETEWETDLQTIASLGLNTVKFWVQWRWNNPSEGVYKFDDIDRLMDLAHKNSLCVMLNTIFDVAPAWVYRKYPDASMITLDGRQIGPQTQPHRQIGGLGLCLNHPQAMEHFFAFLRETVVRYKDHPALEMWNVASEPELTSSMAEMRLFAGDASKIGDMLCYCPHCRSAFTAWLEDKYGSVEALNLSWNRNYVSFEEIELPKTRNTFNDMIDWRMFFVHVLGENVRKRFDAAKQADGKHPLLCHHVFIQGFPVTSTANDPWNVAQFGDLHGFTQMDDPMMSDILRSCAKGRPVISAEMLMMYGYTLELPRLIDGDDIKRFVFTGIAANQKGFVFWQYRPETLGREAPAWGLTRLDGSPTPWLQQFAEAGKALQKNAAFLLDAKPRPAEIAILYSPENQIFSWTATGSEMTATDSLLGVHTALYERNFNVDFIHPSEFENDILAQYRVLYIPFPYCLSEPVCRAIGQWVEKGGTLIGEAYFAGWDRERGTHATTIPGYGLHRVFKVRQATVYPHPAPGMTVRKNLGRTRSAAKIRGALVQETFLNDGAEVLATFGKGLPAVTRAAHGSGWAVLIGSFVGLVYRRLAYKPNGDLIADLVAAGVSEGAPRTTTGRVRIDILTSADGQAMLILRNLESKPVRTGFWIPLRRASKGTEQFSGESISLKAQKDGVSGTVSLKGGEVKVYLV
ncbi:MAG: beta-galactosidase [Ignavibacteriales bacterium]|nr:beta-galactosidase [Ignavibacteriales bacterium]